MKVADPAVFEIRKATILQHARHLFATKGFSDTTMDDIAQACKMQKASLYHYFHGKNRLLREMIDRGCARWFSQLSHWGEGKTLRETLSIIARDFLSDMEDPERREFFKIIHYESHRNPLILKAWRESPMQNREGLYAVFEKHLQGRLTRPGIRMFVTQFMGALIHYVSLVKFRSHDLGDLVTDGDFIEQLVAIFSRGVENAAN